MPGIDFPQASKLAEQVSPSEKKITKTIMEQSFKKYCFTDALDDTDHDSVWKNVCTGNFHWKFILEIWILSEKLFQE